MTSGATIQSEEAFAMLRLSLTPGLGPVLTSRLIEQFGSAQRACDISPAQLRQIHGIGEGKGAVIAKGLTLSKDLANEEVELANKGGARILTKACRAYPALLRDLPDSPVVLYVRGTLLSGEIEPMYSVGMVGSRKCTAYGLEQANFFASSLARAGLCIVSGGARGIDSSAHKGALAAAGRTIAVLGCGLLECYPPENKDLFDEIAKCGAVVSELPMRTPPQAENFPARNRIISGLSLGIVVIEAGLKSGALITAKVAAEEHGREVMAIPGRIDSTASRGTLELLKAGGAALITEPGDVLAILESPARHQHAETHASRYGMLPFESDRGKREENGEVGSDVGKGLSEGKKRKQVVGVTALQRSILDALDGGSQSVDELTVASGLDVVTLRREITLLEMQKRIVREGSVFSKK